MTFHENILNCFQDIERIQFCEKPMYGQMDRQELRFLSSACRLTMLYISVKFHENVYLSIQIFNATRKQSHIEAAPKCLERFSSYRAGTI